MCGNYEGDNDLIIASVHANVRGLDQAILLHQRCQHPLVSDQCLPTTIVSRLSSWPCTPGLIRTLTWLKCLAIRLKRLRVR